LIVSSLFANLATSFSASISSLVFFTLISSPTISCVLLALAALCFAIFSASSGSCSTFTTISFLISL
jgi:hypothetical protein